MEVAAKRTKKRKSRVSKLKDKLVTEFHRALARKREKALESALRRILPLLPRHCHTSSTREKVDALYASCRLCSAITSAEEALHA